MRTLPIAEPAIIPATPLISRAFRVVLFCPCQYDLNVIRAESYWKGKPTEVPRDPGALPIKLFFQPVFLIPAIRLIRDRHFYNAVPERRVQIILSERRPVR